MQYGEVVEPCKAFGVIMNELIFFLRNGLVITRGCPLFFITFSCFFLWLFTMHREAGSQTDAAL